MLAAVATMMVAAGVLAAWKDLPGLLVGRLITGVAVGLAAGTAITYLIELRLRADPKASPVRARTIGTSVNVGALGHRPADRRLPRAVGEHSRSPCPTWCSSRSGRSRWSACGAAPETGAPTAGRPRGASRSRRTARLPVPAAAGDPGRLRGERPVRRAVRALPRHHACTIPRTHCAGATLFIVFSCGSGCPSWPRPGCRHRGCSRSARSPCSSASCCSWSRCAFRPRAWRCS